MSVLRPAVCPECGSTDFTERWRHEAGDFGLPEDTAGYDCADCLAEFASTGEVFRKGDPERFCDVCGAGTDSSEHHEKCGATSWA